MASRGQLGADDRHEMTAHRLRSHQGAPQAVHVRRAMSLVTAPDARLALVASDMALERPVHLGSS